MADDIRQRIAFDAKQAIAELQKLRTSLLQANAAMIASGQAVGQFNAQGGKLDATAKGAAASAQQMARGYQAVNPALAANVEAVRTTERAIRQFGGQVNTTTKDVGVSWKALQRIFAAFVIRRIISEIGVQLRQASVDARNFEKSVAEVGTISRTFRGDLAGTAAELRSISREFGTQIDQDVAGLYEIISNQVADGADAFQFLRSSLDFANTTLATSADGVNLLSSAILSFDLSAADADIVAGKFFRTIDLGRIRASDLANDFGRVAQLANSLGVSLDETLAGLATLTISGLKATEAMTLMNNVMLKLIRPTDTLKARLDELGVSSAEVGIQAFGFQGFLEQIIANANGSSTEIGELFGRVRAIRGALGLGTTFAERFADSLREIQEAGVETLDEARELIFETNAKRIEQEIADLNATMLRVGDTVNAVFIGITDAFGGATSILQALGISASVAATTFLLIRARAAAATVQVTGFTVATQSATTSLRAFALANPLATVGVVVGAALVAINTFRNRAKRAAEEVRRERERADRLAESSARARVRAEDRILDEQLSDFQKFLTDKRKLEIGFQRDALLVQAATLGVLQDQIQDRVSALDAFASGVSKIAATSRQDIGRLQNAVLTAQDRVAEFRFEQQQALVSPRTQVFSALERANALREQATRLSRSANDADRERAQVLFQQAETIARGVQSAAQQTGSRALVARVNESILSNLEAQAQVERESFERERQRIALAKTHEGNIRAQVSRIQELAQRITQLQIISTRGGGILGEQVFRSSDEVQQALGNTLQEFEKELSLIGRRQELADALGLGDFIRQAREQFQSAISGERVTLTVAFDDSIALIFNQLTQAVNDIAPSIREGFSGLIGESRTIEDMQQKIVRLREGIDAARKSRDQATESERQFNNALKEGDAALRQADIAIKEHNRSLGAGTPGGVPPAAQQFLLDNEPILDAVDAFNQAGLALIRFQKTGETTNLDTFTTELNRVREVQRGLAEDARTQSGAQQEATKTASDSVGALVASLLVAQQRSLDIRAGIEGVFNSLGQEALPIVTERVNALTQVIAAANREIAALKANIDAVSRGVTQPRRPNNQTNGRQLGGRIPRFQGGGSVGTDSIMAALSPGEFVVNRRSAQQFFSQLQAINAGQRPVFRETGGSVNVGDVNITVPQGTSETQVRDIGMKLRRAIRKGALKL